MTKRTETSLERTKDNRTIEPIQEETSGTGANRELTIIYNGTTIIPYCDKGSIKIDNLTLDWFKV